MTATAIPSAVIVPEMVNGGNTSATTSASGSVFLTFPAAACKQVAVVNNTGTDIEVQQDGAGVALPVINGTAYPFYGLSNASQLGVRRIDQSITQVVVKARWEA